MGTTPEPPSGVSTGNVCNGLVSCTASLHSSLCAHVAAEVRKADAKRYCSTHGHDWQVISQGWTPDPVKVFCPRCNRSYRCEPTTP